MLCQQHNQDCIIWPHAGIIKELRSKRRSPPLYRAAPLFSFFCLFSFVPASCRPLFLFVVPDSFISPSFSFSPLLLLKSITEARELGWWGGTLAEVGSTVTRYKYLGTVLAYKFFLYYSVQNNSLAKANALARELLKQLYFLTFTSIEQNQYAFYTSTCTLTGVQCAILLPPWHLGEHFPRSARKQSNVAGLAFGVEDAETSRVTLRFERGVFTLAAAARLRV